MRQSILLAGPVLFLVAQIILPGGATNFEERLVIVQDNTGSWISGHILVMTSLPLLSIFFYRWYEIARLNYKAISAIGIWMILWGLMADFSIAAFQLVIPGNADAARIIMSDQLIQATVFLPYLLLLPGAILLSVPLIRIKDYQFSSIALLITGCLLVGGGIMQVKVLFILAAVTILLQAILFLKTKK